jgi:hypothetical protein
MQVDIQKNATTDFTRNNVEICQAFDVTSNPTVCFDCNPLHIDNNSVSVYAFFNFFLSLNSKLWYNRAD